MKRLIFSLLVALCCLPVIAPQAAAQSAGDFGSGFGLQFIYRRPFHYDLKPATIKQIGDSLGYNAGALPLDSIARIGRHLTVTAAWTALQGADTSQPRYFGPQGPQNGASMIVTNAAFVAPYSLVPYRICIAHWAPYGGVYYHRDTCAIVFPVGSGVNDSITAGTLVSIRYKPAQYSGTVQAVQVATRARNGSQQTVISAEVQVPLVLGMPSFVSPAQMGWYVDHWMTVTIEFLEKIPGRIY